MDGLVDQRVDRKRKWGILLNLSERGAGTAFKHWPGSLSDLSTPLHSHSLKAGLCGPGLS